MMATRSCSTTSMAQRWVFSQFSVSTTPYLQCIAVSTTSDATGTYNRYSFQYSNFDDYPKMSVWPDAYYETFNMFAGGTTFVGADACAYNRSAMLAGTAATQVCFQQGTSVGGLLPSDLDGTTAPPAGSPNYMLYFGTNNLNLFKFHVDFTTPSNSTFTGPTVINVAAFSPLCGGGTCVPQPSTTQQLDSLADRLMYRLAYRNFGSHESLVVNHSVVAGSGGGVRWYEIQNPSGHSRRGAAEHVRSRLQLSMDGIGSDGSGRRPGCRLQRVEQFDIAIGSIRRARAHRSSQHAGVGGQHRQRQRFADRQPVALGRLQRHAGRSGGRLYLLVHGRVHEDDRQL